MEGEGGRGGQLLCSNGNSSYMYVYVCVAYMSFIDVYIHDVCCWGKCKWLG